jgi:flagellum-specific peptidoglycan hydrolase FlgJ
MAIRQNMLSLFRLTALGLNRRNKMFNRIIILIIGSFLAILPFSTVLAEEVAWGCYDPQPNHPTQDERKMFLERMRPIASQVQAELGVPRAGILAMSVQESGYGWTRTAIHANNLFGWKFGKSARAAKLKSWTLECQPPSDPGKAYAIFPNWEESMRFVARELSHQKRYSKATLAAHDAITKGKPEEELTEAWLRAIQKSGYNPNPQYPDHVLKAGREAGVFSDWK